MPSPAEQRISWLLIGLLPLIAAAIYAKGRSFDPNLFALNPASLGASHGTSAQIPAVGLPGDPELPSELTTTQSLALPRRLAGLDWDADGPPERFNAQTLYQKIDGRADEYLKDGFTRLDAISYARGTRFIDVLVYDMGTPAHANARFTSERPASSSPIAAGDEAYCVASSCFVLSGSRYAQIIGSEPGAEMERAARDTARALATLISGGATLSGGAALLGPRNK